MDAGKPFLAVINQVDKIEPYREWDIDERKPSSKQLSNIEVKRKSVAGLLGIPMSKVIAVSANERYGIVELVDSIVHELPNNKKTVVLEKIKAAEKLEIEALNAKAAETKARVDELKAKAEAEKVELEKRQAEHKDNESQRRHEIEMTELKARHNREQREADAKARKDLEAAEERERNRNVSYRAEREAETGIINTLIEGAKYLGKKLMSFFGF